MSSAFFVYAENKDVPKVVTEDPVEALALFLATVHEGESEGAWLVWSP